MVSDRAQRGSKLFLASSFFLVGLEDLRLHLLAALLEIALLRGHALKLWGKSFCLIWKASLLHVLWWRKLCPVVLFLFWAHVSHVICWFVHTWYLFRASMHQ